MVDQNNKNHKNNNINNAKQIGNKTSDIYDIVCYCDEESNEHHSVNELIKNIEKNPALSRRKDRFINLKLVGCLLINILLSTPIYAYGTIYYHKKSTFDQNPSLIWPPILYNSVYLLVTPWLFNTTSTPSTNSSTPSLSKAIKSKLTNRAIIIIFTLVLSTGISTSGTFMMLSINNFLLMLIFYSIFGGISSCIIMGKLFVMINTILNNEKMYLINFIYSAGQALSQLICPMFLTYALNKCCSHGSLLILGAIILHIIPISMMILPDKIKVELRVKTPTKLLEERNNNPNESRFSDISQISFEFNEIKYPSDLFEHSWKNPSDFGSQEDSKEETAIEIGPPSVGDDFMQNLDNNRVMNEDGVEIMQIIVEEEEPPMEEARQYVKSAEEIYEEINKIHEQKQQEIKDQQHVNRLRFFKNFIVKKFQKSQTLFYKQFFNPLRRSFALFKFYPTVLLKSVDVFSYLLFITLILPNLYLINFSHKINVIFLIAFMAACWILYVVINLKFHKQLKEKQNYWHIVGILAKFFGYLFTNQRYSFNGFIFGLFIISIGHANSFHLQEVMIRNEFHPRKWYYVRGSIYSFSGFLIIIYSISFHFLYINITFVNFCNIFVVFNLFGLLFWLLTHYKILIYLIRRY